MKDLKKYLPLGTAMLFGLAAFNEILTGEHYDVPLFNYQNFSNILVFTFNLVRGLSWYALPILIFLTWKSLFVDLVTKIPLTILIIYVLLAICYVSWQYYGVDMSFYPNRFAILIAESGIFGIGVILKSKQASIDFEIVKLSFLLLFLFLYVKINFKNNIHEINKNRDILYNVIKYKDDKKQPDTLMDNKHLITNTIDFVFTYDEKGKVFTAIPMSEIKSISIIKK